MSFIEININNSFNKPDNQPQKLTINESTLNNDNLGHRIEVNSINTTSLTNSVTNGKLNIDGNTQRKTLISEIFVGAIVSVIGSVIAFVITNLLR